MPSILIFDDDEDILELCSIILKDKGYHAVSESNSRQVVEKVLEISPDVILMDNWIPGVGGVKAIQLLKENSDTAKIPVILFSANNNIEEIAADAKADYFLKKPFDIGTLSTLVNKAISDSGLAR
jgi:DNA-binding NtrC family response regulator